MIARRLAALTAVLVATGCRCDETTGPQPVRSGALTPAPSTSTPTPGSAGSAPPSATASADEATPPEGGGDNTITIASFNIQHRFSRQLNSCDWSVLRHEFERRQARFLRAFARVGEG
jgi:hypothetical protein